MNNRHQGRSKANREKTIGRGRTPSPGGRGSRSAVDDPSRRRKTRPAPPSTSTNPEASPLSTKKKANELTSNAGQQAAGELPWNSNSTTGAPPPQTHQWRWRETPQGRGRVREDLFQSAAVATASPPTPGTQAPPATTGAQTLAPPPSNGDEQNLILGGQLPKLYTSARRFRGPSPSLTPQRQSKRREAAGSGCLL